MVDFYKSLLKSRVLALMHGSKQLQYSASVVRKSGNISMCILIRILKLQLLKGIDLLWKSSAVYMYINQNILDIHISHIQQFFPEKKQRFKPITTVLLPLHWACIHFCMQNFLLSLKHIVYLPYWWCVTTQFLVALRIGWSNFPTQLDQSEALYWSG